MSTCRAITQGPDFHWFGYYDERQFDPTGRFALGMAVDFEHRNPEPDDVVEVGMVDLHDGDRWIELGESRAWCWQEGCHLQWRPGSGSEVLWNDRQDGRFVAVVLDVKTKKQRILPRPIDNLSPDGRWALGVDFARIRDFRAGYGYAGVPDANRDLAAFADSGVWRMDLDTGEHRSLISCAQLGGIEPLHPEAVTGSRRYVNHVQWNPQGSRFLFLDRDQAMCTRLFTANADGSDLRMAMFGASHYTWRDDEHILVWVDGGYRLYRDPPMARPTLLWTGTACNRRSRGRVRLQERIRSCGSPRSCTTSATPPCSGRLTSASSATPHRVWTGRHGSRAGRKTMENGVTGLPPFLVRARHRRAG